MIKYSLKCDQGHRFDSWFDGAQAFEKLHKNNMISCSICTSTQVERALMSPQLGPKHNTQDQRPLSAPASPAQQALVELRKKIETQTDDVGRDFARQARAMHDGDLPDRAIRGEAKWDDAKALIHDGVPIMPLPWGSKKTN